MSDYGLYGLVFGAVAFSAGMVGFVLGRWLGAREERERCVFWSGWPADKSPSEGRSVVFIQPPSQGLN